MPSEATVKIGGQSRRLRIDVERIRERLASMGHTAALEVTLEPTLTPAEYYRDDETDFVTINPAVVVLSRLGMVPALWPAAWCPEEFYRRRLTQTLAHELRHALQVAGCTPLTDADVPWLSYETLKRLGRLYALVAVAAVIGVQVGAMMDWPPIAILALGGGVLVLGLLYVVLAYFNYHRDPAEVDARRYERDEWQTWSDCIVIEAPQDIMPA